MEFVRIEQLESPPRKVVARLKQVLGQQGFGSVAELEPTGDEQKGEGPAADSVLVVAYCSDLGSRAHAIAPEAALLLTTTFLVRPSGSGSQVSILDPQVLSLVPNREELQGVVRDMRERTQQVLQDVKKDGADEHASDEGAADESSSESGIRPEQVEQRLYQSILQALDQLGDDVGKNSKRLFVLAKAYAAVASLERAEEVELHLE
jgi:hypothetical protein